MSVDGQRLLDESDWIVESTAILPNPDPVALSWLSVQLGEELQAVSLEPGELGPAVERLLLGALDLDVDIDRDSVVLIGEGDEGEDAFRHVVAQFADASRIYVEGYDLVDILEELPIPVFQSRPKITTALKEYVLMAGEVIVGVGHVAPYVVGGHAAVVLVAVAPPIGGAVIIGSAAALAGIAVAGRLRRRGRDKKAAAAGSPAPAPGTEDPIPAQAPPETPAATEAPRTQEEVRVIQEQLKNRARGLPRRGP